MYLVGSSLPPAEKVADLTKQRVQKFDPASISSDPLQATREEPKSWESYRMGVGLTLILVALVGMIWWEFR